MIRLAAICLALVCATAAPSLLGDRTRDEWVMDYARRLRDRRSHPSAPQASETLPAVLTDAALVASLQLWVSGAHTTHMYQESGVDGVPINHATVDAQEVGLILDPSNNAHIVNSSGTTRQPALGTDGSDSQLVFDNTTLDRLLVADSEAAFSNFHVDHEGTVIMIGVEMTNADSALMYFWDNYGTTTTNKGIQLRRSAANKVQLVSVNGVGAVCNGSSAASFVQATGKIDIVIRMDGASGFTIRVGAGGADEPFTCSSAGVAGNSTAVMTIGGNSVGATVAKYNMSHLMFFDRALTNDEVTTVLATPKVRTTDSLLRARPAAAGCWSFLNVWYDFTDATTVFEDTACTNAAEDGDGMLCVKDKRDLSNTWTRIATSTTASPPTWEGADGARWGGTGGQTLLFGSVWARAGATTTLIRAINEDATLGSHVSVGGDYVPMTGENYSGNSGNGGLAYFVVHSATGNNGAQISLADDTGWNWIEIVRDSNEYTCSASGADVTVSTADVLNDPWAPTSIGRESNPGWKMHGSQRQHARFNIALTAAQIASFESGCVDH